MYKELPYNITQIDTGLICSEVAACYMLESDGEIAIVETGNFATTQRILSLIEQKQLLNEKVRYVIPTHVHLDHAGGASSLLDALPNAKLVIHPRGARHMIDPTKLIMGATVVYGEERFKSLYGDIQPIAEDRVIIAEDNSILTFGSRSLLFRDTPGHASHHFCIWDELSSGWFTGDTFGIAYPKLTNNNQPFLFPTTTPVQFDPKQLINSIELMMSYEPKKMYLTHFGAIDVNKTISDELIQQIHDYVDIINSQADGKISMEKIQPLLTDYTYQRLSIGNTKVSLDEFNKIMSMDLELNSQGLIVWYSRQTPKA